MKGIIGTSLKIVKLLTVGSEGLDPKKKEKLLLALEAIGSLSVKGLQNMEVEVTSDSLRVHFRKDF